ncbi:epiplakin [Corapipo altera]|uniref:epiplakin n=1 Tax=Corapipo altera TaxID=415028 RepID=UPI000FD66F4F|nr:epiplakin [Corapipo altera]
MESKPAVNGHAAPSFPGEDTPGKSHSCQEEMPRKQPRAAGGDAAGPDAPGEPSEAAGSIAGVYVEASKKIMSFYEATREHLLSLDPALSLLEAQAATGSVADPVTRRRVSVADAVRLGLAMQKELVGWEQGTRLLQAQMATGGIIDPATGARLPADVACERGYLDEEMSQHLSDPSHEDSRGFLDPSTTEKVTYSELRKRCVVDPASGFLLLPLQITFPGLGGRVSSRDLRDSGIISHDVFRGLEEGTVSAQELAENDVVQQFLRGTRSVAGVVLPSGEQRSLYQALREHLLVPGAALMLLQVQASTGSLTDPLKNKTYSVDEAVRVGFIGPELHEKLSSAEKTVTGYRDPSTGEMLSLFQAIRKGFVPRDHGLCLLEAQMATGGVIAPGRHLRVPTETACEWGYLDEATRQLLSSPPDHMKGFFDPSSKEKLSYSELLQRCVTDPGTGLLLLPLAGDGGEGPQGTPLFFDHRAQTALENTRVPISVGKFKGKSVSLWKLLFSDHVPGERRAALAQQFLSGALSTQGLGEAVRAAIEETAATANVTFEGLRDQVTADQLLSSEIINKDLFKKLKEGETSAREVVGMDTVRKYLQGTGSIAGLLLPDSQEKISIYQAKRKGLLRPGTSLILLEAQAATGFVIDPTANKRYSVDEALRANVIGPDVYDKLLAAEKSVTGYRDPYSGSKISLFQAMQKDLIVRDHGIRLLEAQIATGGIIDPVHSHRIPVEVAYKRGYFDKKMNLILSDPSDDTKGFFDPNTHENLTYLQLKEKCITEPSTGLCLLPLNSRKRQFIDEATRQVFRSSWLPVRFGRLRGEKVSVWDLLNSEYFSEGRRREIFNHFQLRKLSLEQIRLLLEEEMKKWAPIKFPAMRGSVSAYHLMETGVIDRALFEKVLEGSVTPEQVLHMDSVRKYLYGSGSIGGIVLQPSNQRMSIYEAMKQNIVVPGVALPLLEAQAATGFIIDPVNNQKLRVDEAVREGVIGPDVHEKLQHAEGAVTGYKDPFTGKKIPLFQAMKKGLITDKQAMQLMEVQMATGGIIDPACGHHIPLESAQQRGCLDEDTSKALSKPSDEHRAFCLPDSKESVTYAELIQHCQKDDVSGFHLLPLPQTAAPAYTDEQIQRIFKETTVKEKGVSLWELIHSGYFTEEQRGDFVERFRSEELSLQQLVALVLRLVGDMEMKARTQISLEGLRGSVPVVWLLDTGIISEKTFEELAQGIRTPEEVAAMEGVKRYLQGTGSIAGVFIEESKQKMSFYDAMKSNLLLPGAALRLLEAQAATGYLTDPATNRRLSVRDAVRAAVVGEELTEKLLLAERAVTGYTDPYTGSSISLCQALRKELIPLAEAVPLLEAQLATGGVVDPIHHLHLPLQAACRYGFYDEGMHQTLSQLNDSTKVFFDPNTKENVTYQQLKERCILEPGSGLWLLPLSENSMFCVDEQTMEVLKSVTVCVNVGRFKGQTVSVWDLLNSEYFSDSKRRELVRKYKDEKTEVLQEITTIITTIIQETEAQGKKFAFQGLRKRVSASDLFQSQLIDKKTLDELNQGKKTVKEVTEMESVRRYLEGSNFIAGVLIQPSNEKMSIYQAMWKGILRPGTALVLLEAQAATGYIIDPEKNQKFSVEEALKEGLIGGEVFEKLLCAERAVTGYTDPYTKAPMSLFEAMNQGLIVKSHGIRLLEAQIATGGIIDPVHSHRLPVEVAYKRGYFDQEMNQILSDPSDDTKGFFDPNTHENLTYMQLLERCVQDPETGLYMLQVVKEGGKYFYIDESTKQALRSKPLQVKVGKFKGQTVSIWEVLCSHYISEQKRKELVMQYKSKTLTLENLISLILKIIEDTEQRAEALKVKGLRGDVSVSELFNSEIIDKKTLDQLHDGSLTLAALAKRDSIQRYLDGTGSIAGVLLPQRKEKMSIYQALKKGLLTEQCALGLLEAQAATGFLIDPLSNQKLSVGEAVASGLVGSELHEPLLLAEKAVTGYTDPQTGDKISLFQAVRQKRTARDHGIRLLEAQLATGGIVDPAHGHRLPLDVAYRRGHLDEDMFLLLSDPDHGSKGFIDPNTREKISYSQLLQRCAKDRESGLYLLQVLEKQDDYFYVDEQTKNTLLCTMVQVPVGKYKGQVLSLWELLCSEYITEEKRKELLKKYKAESQHILQGIIEIILKIIREKEEDRSDVWFQGIRQQITASELLSAQIITEETIEKLHEGKETAQEIAQMDSVRRYLEGTGSIAGVLVPSKADPAKNKKLSVYDAMMRGLLTPGTALVLLEAQAASGLLTDPVRNEQLSVKAALASGLIGRDFYEKLLSAEGAVTGYTEPYTGRRISLFRAMEQEFIVREHAIRLLGAQVATGGIIDPERGHRVPVEVACECGYLDQETGQFLRDPENQTRSCFDPNTHENLTYVQLLRRCVPDPDTGLLMLQLMDKGSVLYQLTEDARKALQAARTTLSLGLFQGQSVTLWELLFSRYVPELQREELLRKYRAGTVTVQQMIDILTATVTEMGNGGLSSPTAQPHSEVRAAPPARDVQSQEQQLRKSLKSATVRVTAGELRGQNVSLLDLLFSKYVPQGKRQELLELYRAGILSTEQVATVVTTILNRTEAANAALAAKARNPHRAVARAGDDGDGCSAQCTHLDDVLKSTTVSVPAGKLRGRQVSLWDLLFSDCIAEEKRQELLELYHEGLLTLEQMTAIVTTLVKKKESTSRKFQIKVKGSDKDTVTGAAEEETLKATPVEGSVGELQGRQVSLWDLLFSDYIPEEKRQELLELYREGTLALEQLTLVVTTLIKKKESTSRKFQIKVKGSDKDTVTGAAEGGDNPPREEPRETALKATVVDVEAGEFRGHRVSVWDLLHSQYIPEENRKELLELYEAGELTLEQVKSVVTTIVTKAARAEQTSPLGGPEAEPTGTEAEPKVTEAEPTGTEAEPMGTEAEPKVTEAEPKVTEAEPTVTEAEPRVTEAEPTPLRGDMTLAEALKATPVEGSVGELQGRQLSLWDLLFSEDIPEGQREELLELYREGTPTLQELLGTTSSRGRHLAALPRQTVDLLRSEGSYITLGPCQERRVSVWELLCSKQVSEYKREAHLDSYGAGGLTVNRITITTTVTTGPQRQRSHQRHH